MFQKEWGRWGGIEKNFVGTNYSVTDLFNLEGRREEPHLINLQNVWNHKFLRLKFHV